MIHVLVADNQSCRVPGRYIGEKVSFLCDVVEFPTTFASKAFDRVDWGFMYATLSKMGFGVSFLDWVKLFYTDVQSAVM